MKHIEPTDKLETKQDEPVELSDEALERVSGGLMGSDRCPECGSELQWLGNSIQMYACANPNCNFVGA